MVCLNPKPVKFEWSRIIDQKTGEIRPAKQPHFLNPYTAKIDENTDFIPCGKCEGCLIDKANDWATRAYLESTNHSENCFVTLTYDNEHLPKPKSLKKRDLQLFWKRLRKKIAPQKISYLACGEMGPNTRRPHYHALIFGYWPSDAKPFKTNTNKDILYTSEQLAKIWGNGFVLIGHVTYQSAAYVARYVYKKAYGGQELNLKPHQEKEFITASKNPAIAKNFYFDEEKWNLILRNNGIFIPTPNGIILKKIPKYLRNKWKFYDWNSYYAWQDYQKFKIKENQKQVLSKTSKNWYQYKKTTDELKRKKLNRLDKYRNVV